MVFFLKKWGFFADDARAPFPHPRQPVTRSPTRSISLATTLLAPRVPQRDKTRPSLRKPVAIPNCHKRPGVRHLAPPDSA